MPVMTLVGLLSFFAMLIVLHKIILCCVPFQMLVRIRNECGLALRLINQSAEQFLKLFFAEQFLHHSQTKNLMFIEV